MSELTTYGLGGKILNCYFPKTPYQAKKIYSQIIESGEEVVVLGNGSNVLASDKDLKCSVICLKKMSGIIRISENQIYCLAGTKISKILLYCKKHNLSGLEYMYGIPATVGGAAYMNAGVADCLISNNIVNVDYLGDICGKISNFECKFSYKHSIMRDINGLILAVTLKLTPSNSEDIEARIAQYKKARSHLPNGRSCGCVFKNGENYSAGKLIDGAGLKGFRLGNAYVSPVHANFIICDGDSADDVRRLIDIIKLRVFDCFGVNLQEEVVYIGDF